MLTEEEQKLLSVAYQNQLGLLRIPWRTTAAKAQKEESAGSKFAKLAREYKERIEREYEAVCRDLISLVDKYLLPRAVDPRERVFYLKLQADYYRRIAEIVTAGQKRMDATQCAHRLYIKAAEKAASLPPTNALRLNLELNYATFCSEILGLPELAIKIARTGFESAVDTIERLDNEDFEEATLIMNLLRDSITTHFGIVDANDQDDN